MFYATKYLTWFGSTPPQESEQAAARQTFWMVESHSMMKTKQNITEAITVAFT